MLTIPVVPMNPEKHHQGSQCISHNTLPLFYMSDFSIMGLKVSPYHKAIQILKKQNHRLNIDHTRTSLTIDDFLGLEKVIIRLQKEAIQCNLSDIATDIYQG